MPRTLIVGDVHGCAREVDRLLRKTEPKRVILVGDPFTRGPDPRGVCGSGSGSGAARRCEFNGLGVPTR